MSSSALEMCSTVKHFSHPKHPLVLKESDVIGDDAICYVCNTTVVGLPTYTCSSSITTDECTKFYLHKSCAELPTHLLDYYKHDQHPLALIPAHTNEPIESGICNVCYGHVQFAYICDDCQFHVCVFCAFEKRALDHPGHEKHTLILVPRESSFICDACNEEAKDSSYICTTCDFWIHKDCALAPFTISTPTYHHHSLNLVYSIPKMHRYFNRFCGICDDTVHISHWLYYCQKCTYFVHMKCATSSYTTSTVSVNEIEEEGIDTLTEFPLHNEESLFDLIIAQCGKLQLEYQGKDDNNVATSTIDNDSRILKNHWSHQKHPLIQFTIGENDNCDRNVLICDGCIQPITVFHPSYYACIQCGFFLHSFCATKLPKELVAGVSPFHPQHSLFLRQKHRFYTFVECRTCTSDTNGFYYDCQACDFIIDIRCAFLPRKIKHKSHKHHSLVQRPSTESVCKASNFLNDKGVEYGCETCSKFQINIDSVFYPSRMKHKYDDHPITLRHPPFFYEGIFYCEICEEQVDNYYWLYNCGECDHSFHHACIRWTENVKLGGTIEFDFNNRLHTLTLVLKRLTRKKGPLYYCEKCGFGSNCDFFMECDGCGYLFCRECLTHSYDGDEG